MTNTDPVCPNCGRYLAHVGPDHFMFCHLQPKLSSSVFSEPLTSTTDTGKRLSEEDARVLAELEALPTNDPRIRDKTLQEVAVLALAHLDAIERLSEQRGGKMTEERAQDILRRKEAQLISLSARNAAPVGYVNRVAAVAAILQAFTEASSERTDAEAISTFLQEVIDAMNGDGPAFKWREDSASDALDYLGMKAERLLSALPVSEDGSASQIPKTVTAYEAMARLMEREGKPIAAAIWQSNADQLKSTKHGAVSSATNEGDGE